MSTKDFWKKQKKPIVGLSPMDGYSDSAFRRICKKINPELITVTEFTSADGLSHKAKRLLEKLAFHPDEQPIIAQIFGKNTESFIRAAKICTDLGFSGIDINMGCPSKKVVKSEHGIALRKKPDLAFKLIESVATNTDLPVSVKTRLGWDNAKDLASFAKGIENAGANMLCIHARTYKEPYNVPAQWDPLLELKSQIKIPLIGNGGITNYDDGLTVCEKLDGFYIGQAAFGNPWVFSKTKTQLPFHEKIPIIYQHAKWMIESKGPVKGIREMRKHLGHYLKHIPNAKQFRFQLMKTENLNELKEILQTVSQSLFTTPAIA